MSPQLQSPRLVCVCWALLAAVLAGCSWDSRPPLNKVKGQVFFKKTQPAGGALIVFHPQSEALAQSIKGRPFAYVEPDGSFNLTTFGRDDGAPAGEYAVTIVWEVEPPKSNMPSIREGKARGPDQLGGRYGDPRKPLLKATVAAGDNDFRFDVE